MKSPVDMDVPCQCVLQIVVRTPGTDIGAIAGAEIVLSQCGTTRFGELVAQPSGCGRGV